MSTATRHEASARADAYYLRVEVGAGLSNAERGNPYPRLRAHWEPTLWDYPDGTRPIRVPEGATVLITVKLKAPPGVGRGVLQRPIGHRDRRLGNGPRAGSGFDGRTLALKPGLNLTLWFEGVGRSIGRQAR